MSAKKYVLVTAVLCALTMCCIDGILQPPYAVKSVIMILLFLL